nr:MAG TPA: Acetone carboxylase alpha subunit [Caudoviricetes sp.]
MARYDLTGQTFGRWTVLRAAEPGKTGRARWVCRCACGRERIVTADNLRRGVSTSCGCVGKWSRRMDLTGQRFGRLTAIEYLPSSGSRNGARWRCRCDCGREIVAASANLKSGHTTSCGCALAAAQQAPETRVEALKKSPLTGAFETNIRAKRYTLSDGKREWEFRNLSKFVRDNAELFGISTDDTVGMERTAKALYDASRRHYRWHGWSIAMIEESPAAEKFKREGVSD